MCRTAIVGAPLSNPGLDEEWPCRVTVPSATQVVSGMFAATTGLIDDRWQRFMQFQIARTRQIFAEAEAGVNLLAPDARLPVWCAPRSSAISLACVVARSAHRQAVPYPWFIRILPVVESCCREGLTSVCWH